MGNAQSPEASLYIVPSTGSYAVGDTFTVSLYINTAGRAINAIEANLVFPPELIQVVSPSSGKSVIDLWIGQPTFSNSAGTLTFRGAIPNPGLNVSQGLISTVTFRVKSIGKALVDFTPASRVLLNDGLGTDVLGNSSGAIIDLVLPAPGGPNVVSSSHPDQSRWYPSHTVSFSFAGSAYTDGYSYSLDNEPITVPDNISEGRESSITLKNVPDGLHYFHINARSGGVWGGSTHYAVRTDTSPPAAFKLQIEPGLHTDNSRPIIEFATTDGASGVSYYEVKVIGLSASASSTASQQPFSVESASPFLPQLSPGKYEVVVRAHDLAGNVQEAKGEMQIYSSTLSFLSFLTSNTLWFLALLLSFCLVGVYFYRSSRRGVSKKGPVEV